MVSPRLAPPHQAMGVPRPAQHAGERKPRASHCSDPFPDLDSRRSSISSSVHSGFNNLQINNKNRVSPTSANTSASQTSIAATLQRERGIGGRYSNPLVQQPASLPAMSPKAEMEARQAYQSRSAPVISSNPMREVYNADKPTAGQPYAFPDPDMADAVCRGLEDHEAELAARRISHGASTDDSNSTVTRDNRLPPGQHRLDERRSDQTYERTDS